MLKNFEQLKEMLRAKPGTRRVAVAVAQDEHTLQAVAHAANDGLVQPVLIGKAEEIKAILEKIGFDAAKAEIIDIADPVECVQKAADLARDGQADCIMKGKIETGALMKVLVNKDHGIRKSDTMSLVGFFESPHYHKVFAITDPALLIYPTLEQKKAMIANAVGAFHALGEENGAAIAAELGCDNESSLESICARPDVDAVIVATPNYLHKEPVLEAARNHKNVFCEKPIALSYADCDEMVNTCKENNVVFMAGHVMNFFHGVRLAKKFIQEGRIGKVLYAHSARNGWEEPQPSISWKKIRSKSGGHLYHHIHELDCIQFIMGPATRVTMTGGNVAHSGPEFGDEDDMLFLNLEFGNNTYAIVEYGSAFHWPEHYVLIQGTKGAIRIDMCNVGMTVKLADGTEEHYCVHANKEIDDDRTRIYHSTEMDGAIQYGHPGKKPPMWLNSIMNAEMEFFNGVMHGDPIPDEFKPLMTGEAARAAIATADAATLSLRENRKVSVEEVMK